MTEVAVEVVIHVELLCWYRDHLGARSRLHATNLVPGPPKARDGEIMRRLLKARELGLSEGGTSTMED